MAPNAKLYHVVALGMPPSGRRGEHFVASQVYQPNLEVMISDLTLEI
jgi:hypothetical protein